MSIININVKRFNDSAHLPKFATKGAAAADLVATKIVKKGLFRVWYDCEIAMAIPTGYVGLLFSRSSVSNKDLSLANSVGVIDSDYRGTIQLRFNRTFRGFFTKKTYNVGERIGQLLIIKTIKIKYVDSKSLTTTARGEQGFGSTGS